MNESDNTTQDETTAPLFLLQALGLLLEAAQADPGTTEITMQPLSGREQFDFRQENPNGVNAVRIRSTKSMLLYSLVQTLAGELDSDPSLAEGRLVLIGMVHPRLDKINQLGKVALTKRIYDPEMLLHEAATAVGAFRAAAGLPPQSAAVDQAVASCLAMQLGEYCAEPRRLDRAALVALFREAILVATSKTGPV